MSLALLFHYLMLNRFLILLHPFSGACDLFVELFHGLCCCVRIEVFALAYLFSGECFVVTCVVVLQSVFLQILAAAVSCGYWFFFVCCVCKPIHTTSEYIQETSSKHIYTFLIITL